MPPVTQMQWAPSSSCSRSVPCVCAQSMQCTSTPSCAPRSRPFLRASYQRRRRFSPADFGLHSLGGSASLDGAIWAVTTIVMQGSAPAADSRSIPRKFASSSGVVSPDDSSISLGGSTLPLSLCSPRSSPVRHAGAKAGRKMAHRTSAVQIGRLIGRARGMISEDQHSASSRL